MKKGTLNNSRFLKTSGRVYAHLLIVCVCMLGLTQAYRHPAKEVPAVILDTDIGPDYDDVGAIALLHALADRKEVTPLAIIACNKNELVVPSIDVLNTYFGRPKLPTGAPKGQAVQLGASQKWPEMLAAKYPHRIQSTSQAPDAVATYREVLSRQRDGSVTIATIGFLTNLSNLLDSKADRFSALTGKELVRKKVKQLVSMAGWFPQGREFNVLMDSAASARVFAEWPTPVIFTGYEIGRELKTGKRLIADTSLHSPVKDVFARCMAMSKEDQDGRMSWDETAVLVAVRGTGGYFGTKRGRIVINGGNNTWTDDPRGPHVYLTPSMPVPQLTAVIEDLMMHKGK